MVRWRRPAGSATLHAVAMRPRAAIACALLGATAAAAAPLPVPITSVPVEEIRLDNGMRFLLLPRREATTVAAGWVARVGSADERRGTTGVSHLLEHMLFKGTRTVGSRDPDLEERLLAEEDRLLGELEQLEPRPQTARRARRRRQLEARLEEARGEARAAAFLGELSLLYAEVGGIGLNANTLRDLTMFYVTLPAERLETWFWLESDRLLGPVFREFYKERRVIHEERRMRTDSTPTGRLDAELRALFWGDHPYAWQPMGQREDLDRIDRPAAYDHFRRHYRPERLTAALVGGFDPVAVRGLAERYFGRLQAGAGATRPPPPAWRHRPATLNRTCVCPSQVRLLYPTVPFGHRDAAALEVVSGLLNGAAGRLHRSLVVRQGLATAAVAASHPLRQAGYFAVRLEARGGASADELQAAWQRELAALAAQPAPESELRRVRNRFSADHYRQLSEPLALLQRLLVYDGLGSWRQINELPRAVLAVSASEVQAAARRYLASAEPTIGIFRGPPAPGPR